MKGRLTRETPPERFRPLGARVEVELIRLTNETDGGIIIPDRAQWNSGIGRVISTGPDVKQAKRGDLVLIPAEVESRTVRFGGVESYTCEEAHLRGILLPEQAERVLAEQLEVQGGESARPAV